MSWIAGDDGLVAAAGKAVAGELLDLIAHDVGIEVAGDHQEAAVGGVTALMVATQVFVTEGVKEMALSDNRMATRVLLEDG